MAYDDFNFSKLYILIFPSLSTGGCRFFFRVDRTDNSADGTTTSTFLNLLFFLLTKKVLKYHFGFKQKSNSSYIYGGLKQQKIAGFLVDSGERESNTRSIVRERI